VILAVAALTLSLHIQPPSLDMLDGTSIEVIAHNPQSKPVTASFALPSEYEIQILRGHDVIWTSLRPLPPGAHFPAHSRSFMPGPTVLTVYIWNGLAADGTTPQPGEYAVRARLLTAAKPDAAASVRLIDPAPVTALEKLHEGDELTIAGTLDATKSTLTDATGTIRLMKRLLTAPGGTIAVRGYLTTAPGGGKAFYVKRWAPVFEKNSAPVSSPSPAVRRH
jgi:hypothetical protein